MFFLIPLHYITVCEAKAFTAENYRPVLRPRTKVVRLVRPHFRIPPFCHLPFPHYPQVRVQYLLKVITWLSRYPEPDKFLAQAREREVKEASSDSRNMTALLYTELPMSVTARRAQRFV